MHYKNLLLAISLTGLVGCGGGGGSSESSTPTGGDTPIAENFSKTTLVYESSPYINEQAKILIENNTSDSLDNYNWSVISQPTTSSLQLNASNDGQSLSFTPSVAGLYKLSAISNSGEVLETQFLINQVLPFDQTKLKDFDSTEELSKQSGAVTNQAWIYSKTLQQNAIDAIVSNYQGFTIIGYDDLQGLLLEFDETNPQSQINLNQIKTETGVDIVDTRIFEGADFIQSFERTPNDGSAFNDGGDNWHLEHIGIEQAWDITTGSSSFFIGIADSGIDIHHEDLNGRFIQASVLGGDHGTGVAGAIGAISDNDIGMSGINWSNQLIGTKARFLDLVSLMALDDVLLVNSAWSLVEGYISEDFDPSDSESVKEINKISLGETRRYRKHFINKPNKLYINSAGNGIGGGTGNSDGIYGVDGRHGSPAAHYDDSSGEVVLSKLANVIFVASHLTDNRLRNTSNYGQSVDIAAPTGYKSTKKDNIPSSALNPFTRDEYYTADDYGINDPKLNEDDRRSFRGTSAASAVVTGVASLIYSVDKTLTGPEVKSILVNSATNNVTERYISKGTDSNVEALAHPIPILNAASALQMTKEITDAKEIIVDHAFPNPFNPTVNVIVSNANDDIQIQSFEYVVSTRNNGTLEELFDGTVAGFSPLVFQAQDSNSTNYLITGTTKTPAHQPTGLSLDSSYNYEFLIPKVMALSSDKDTQASIPNVSIDIEAEDGSVPLSSDSTDANGSKRLFLKPGKYNIIAKAEGYADLNRSFTLKDTDLKLDVFLELASATNNPDPDTGTTGGNLEPITALTNSEVFTLPVSNIPGVSSLSGTSESGFNGSINEDFSLIDGVSSINAVDIQRDIGVSVICDSDTKRPVSLNASDFSTGSINETFYADGQQVIACSSNYSSVLPLTLTSSNLDILDDWGSADLLSSNCPTDTGSSTTPPLNVSFCTSVITSNYLITDSNGVEHKISKRLTTVPNQ